MSSAEPPAGPPPEPPSPPPPPPGPPGPPVPGEPIPGGQWSQPPPGENRRPTGLIIGLAVGLLVLLCLCCVGAGAVTINRIRAASNNPEPAPIPSELATTTPAPKTAAPSVSPTATPTKPSPSTADLAAVDSGDCVVNSGTDTNPNVRVTPCRQGTLLVLARFNATSNSAVCDRVPRSTHFYVQTNQSNPDRSFVLCMRRR